MSVLADTARFVLGVAVLLGFVFVAGFALGICWELFQLGWDTAWS